MNTSIYMIPTAAGPAEIFDNNKRWFVTIILLVAAFALAFTIINNAGISLPNWKAEPTVASATTINKSLQHRHPVKRTETLAAKINRLQQRPLTLGQKKKLALKRKKLAGLFLLMLHDGARTKHVSHR